MKICLTEMNPFTRNKNHCGIYVMFDIYSGIDIKFLPISMICIIRIDYVRGLSFDFRSPILKIEHKHILRVINKKTMKIRVLEI